MLWHRKVCIYKKDKVSCAASNRSKKRTQISLHQATLFSTFKGARSCYQAKDNSRSLQQVLRPPWGFHTVRHVWKTPKGGFLIRCLDNLSWLLLNSFIPSIPSKTELSISQASSPYKRRSRQPFVSGIFFFHPWSIPHGHRWGRKRPDQ